MRQPSRLFVARAFSSLGSWMLSPPKDGDVVALPYSADIFVHKRGVGFWFGLAVQIAVKTKSYQ